MRTTNLLETRIIIAIAGVSAAGKTTVSEWLASMIGLRLLQSVTTREPRMLETDNDYEWVDDEEFEALMRDGSLAEYQKFGQHWYGLRWAQIRTGYHSVVVLTVGGIRQIMETSILENDNVKVIPVFLDIPRKVMKKRMRYRGDGWMHIARRLALATFDRRQARLAKMEIIDASQPVSDVMAMISMKAGIAETGDMHL